MITYVNHFCDLFLLSLLLITKLCLYGFIEFRIFFLIQFQSNSLSYHQLVFVLFTFLILFFIITESIYSYLDYLIQFFLVLREDQPPSPQLLLNEFVFEMCQCLFKRRRIYFFKYIIIILVFDSPFSFVVLVLVFVCGKLQTNRIN